MSLKKILLTLLVATNLLLFSSITQAQLKVVTTTGMIADLVKNIGGEHIEVTALMGPGVDPHLYKATQGDLRKILKADIIFYNGLLLEGKMQDIFIKIARKQPVQAVSDGILEEHKLVIDDHTDPHIWFDIKLWIHASQNVLKALIEQDPANKQSYQKNAADYAKKLEKLDSWTRKQINSIPAKQRVLITAHDAFGYFGRAYNIQVTGLQGMNTAAEFGLQDIKRLKDLIIANNIKAVFIESSVSPKLIESLVKGVEAEGHQLHIGGKLYSDAMGLEGTPEGTYIGMLKHNVNTIVKALNGK